MLAGAQPVHPYLSFWFTVAGSLGTGAFFGGVLTHILQRRSWLLDNKKLEWRELIDGLHECMEAIRPALRWKNQIEYFTELQRERVQITEGIVRGSRIIADRIFIAPTVEKNGIQKRWHALVEVTQSLEQNPTDLMQAGTKFVELWGNLHADLVRLAREDLATWW